MTRRVLPWLAMMLPCAALATEEISLVVDAGLVSNDNVTRAAASGDVREDTALVANAALAWPRPLGANSMLVWRGGLGFERFAEFDGLSNRTISAAVDYRFRFARGFSAPDYTLSASLAERDFDSAMRDSTQIGLEASMSRRLTDEMSAIVGLALESREAESDSFDTEQTRLFANLDWMINAGLLAYLTWQFVDGDIVSTATPTFEIINQAATIQPDDAFGGAATRRFAYRLDAETTLLTLGVNYALDADSTVDASLEMLDSDAGPIHYDRSVWRVSYLLAF